MARTEIDRDDLFAEAVALSRRVELVTPTLDRTERPVVAGFHRDGRASVYYGSSFADHLDAAGRLTRAFRTAPDGAPRLYRSQGCALAELIRYRSSERTALVRRDLQSGELEAFLSATRVRLHALARLLAEGNHELLRMTDEDPRAELAAFLAAALPTDGPLAPRYKGKR